MTERLSVLVIEDEPLIAMMMEDFVDLLGHDVAGVCDSVASAIDRIGGGEFDVAILDVHLRDGVCWPVADALTAAGKRFLIASGGFVEPPPERYQDGPQLAKPFTLDGVRTALDNLTRV